MIAERVSGETYADYLARHVFTPLGMTNSTAAPSADQLARRATPYYRRASDGSRKAFPYYDMNGLAAAGNIVSSVEDLARFAALQFSDRPAGGAQVPAGRDAERMQRAQFVNPGFPLAGAVRLRRLLRRRRHLVTHAG